MFLPVMPIGVEHTSLRIIRDMQLAVFLPVMPIGVEHLKTGIKDEVFPLVFLPVMPIGVEHSTLVIRKTDGRGVLTCDADRR